VAVTDLKSKVSTYQSSLPTSTVLSSSDCKVDQIRMEMQMCEYRKLHRWACEAEDHCSDNVALEGTQATLQSRQAGRQADKLAFKGIICQIADVLGDPCDSTSLSPGDLLLNLAMPMSQHCKLDQDPEVSTYPSLTDASQCSDWLAQEYATLDSSYTIPSTCQAECVAAPIAASTVAPTAAPAPATPAPTTPAPTTPAPTMAPTPAPSPKPTDLQQKSTCDYVVDWKKKGPLSGTWVTLEGDKDIATIPNSALMIRVSAVDGDLVDYFMPIEGATIQDMIQAKTPAQEQKHLFSYDGIWFTRPGYYTEYPDVNFQGGSAKDWPNNCGADFDSRIYLLFWGRAGYSQNTENSKSCCNTNYVGHQDENFWIIKIQIEYLTDEI